MKQTDMWHDEPTAPYAPNSSTSRAAAEAIRDHINRLQSGILTAFLAAGEEGFTTEEACSATFIAGNTMRPRLIELREKGLIVASGAERKTRSGRRATVWIHKNFVKYEVR